MPQELAGVDVSEMTGATVSVLCTEYKLLSKALAIRLSEVLEQVIHPDQTYCVPGRLIRIVDQRRF